MFRLTPAGRVQWRGRVGGIALKNPGVHKPRKQAISREKCQRAWVTGRRVDMILMRSEETAVIIVIIITTKRNEFTSRNARRKKITSVPNVSAGFRKNLFKESPVCLCASLGFSVPICQSNDVETHSGVEPCSRVAAGRQHRGENPIRERNQRKGSRENENIKRAKWKMAPGGVEAAREIPPGSQTSVWFDVRCPRIKAVEVNENVRHGSSVLEMLCWCFFFSLSTSC